MDAQMRFDEAVEALTSQIDDTAIIACSGGIDSTVAAVLANNAIGNLLHCVYVDTGFMRKGETEEVREMLTELGLNLKIVDASERFFKHLEGVTEPEQKRKVIGEQFIRVFEEEQVLCGAKYLVQGTIAPDWIEACAFAWLAKQTLEKQPLDLQPITGATPSSILGAIFQA